MFVKVVDLQSLFWFFVSNWTRLTDRLARVFLGGEMSSLETQEKSLMDFCLRSPQQDTGLDEGNVRSELVGRLEITSLCIVVGEVT